MNKYDEIIKKNMPVVVVPAYEPLPQNEIGKTRFLMAREGLYIQTTPPWGTLTRIVWRSPRPLPYGAVEEENTFVKVLDDATNIIKSVIVPVAAKYARYGKEYAGLITWHPDGYYEHLPVDFTSTEVEISYRVPKVSNGAHIAIDIHSHGRIRPYFSTTDDADDAGGVKIGVVLGNYRRREGIDTFDSVIRYSVEGFHFYEMSDMEEDFDET